MKPGTFLGVVRGTPQRAEFESATKRYSKLGNGLMEATLVQPAAMRIAINLTITLHTP